MQKKGLSDVITNVLIILLVVIAIGVIAAFVFPLLRGTISESEKSASCLNLDAYPVRCTYVEYEEASVSKYNTTIDVYREGDKYSVEKVSVILSKPNGETESYEVSSGKVNEFNPYDTLRNNVNGLEYKPVSAGASITIQGNSRACSISTAVQCASANSSGLISGGSGSSGSGTGTGGGEGGSGSGGTQYIIPGGAVNYWALNETSGILAFDSRGTDTAVFGGGDFSTHKISGKAGSSGLRFDGTSNYLQMGAGSVPYGANARTFMAWINYSESGGPIYVMWSNTGQKFMIMMNQTTATQFLLFTDATNSQNDIILTGSEIPAKSEWHHIAFIVKNGNNWEYYLDGQQKKTGTFPVAINTGTPSFARIGQRLGTPIYYRGSIDEVIIFNRDLTGTEIRNIYDGSK